jgi:23S rRNA pseudouridine955/2504/2580 synthase
MTKDNIQTVRQFTVGTDDNDIRLDRWFKRHLPQVGFATISRWARTGQIRVDGKRVAPEDHVLRGQLIRVPPATPMSKAPSPRAGPSPACR